MYAIYTMYTICTPITASTIIETKAQSIKNHNGNRHKGNGDKKAVENHHSQHLHSHQAVSM